MGYCVWRRVGIGLVLSVAFAAMGVQVASADDTGMPRVLIRGGNASGTTVPVAAVANPSGCEGQANNPHLSGHVQGSVNAEARTTCRTPVPSIRAQATLQRDVLGGLVWLPVGFDDQTSPGGSRVSAFGNEGCNNATYRLLGYHEETDFYGQVYMADTMSPEIAIVC